MEFLTENIKTIEIFFKLGNLKGTLENFTGNLKFFKESLELF